MTDQEKISDILKRREYFDLHFPPIEMCDARQDISYRLSNTCPSCGYLKLDARCSWEICTFCFWEDDGQDNHDADEVCGGPNSNYSLTAHRLEVYDWMRELKQNEIAIENSIGKELGKLDSYISSKTGKVQLVLEQIELLSRLFSASGQIGSDSKPNWKFLTEKQIAESKPAYNSTLLKEGRTWGQKLFNSK